MIGLLAELMGVMNLVRTCGKVLAMLGIWLWFSGHVAFAGDLFVAQYSDSGNIFRFASDGSRTTFADRSSRPTYLAFKATAISSSPTLAQATSTNSRRTGADPPSPVDCTSHKAWPSTRVAIFSSRTVPGRFSSLGRTELDLLLPVV